MGFFASGGRFVRVKDMPIFLKMFVVCILVTVTISVLSGGITYVTASDIILQKTIAQTEETINQVSENYDSFMEVIVNRLDYIAFNPTVQDELLNGRPGWDEEGYYSGTRMVKRLLVQMFKYFGSALKQSGVKELLEGLARYGEGPSYGKTFAARVFKITRDEQGNRLTHMKITGGSLKVNEELVFSEGGPGEKINQIRVYCGARYEAVLEAYLSSYSAVL